jgi:hypothetical protein
VVAAFVELLFQFMFAHVNDGTDSTFQLGTMCFVAAAPEKPPRTGGQHCTYHCFATVCITMWRIHIECPATGGAVSRVKRCAVAAATTQ